MDIDIFVLEKTDHKYFEALFRGDLDAAGETGIVFGAVADGEPAGLAVLEIHMPDRSCWLNWLYVRAEKRNNGIGSKLLFFIRSKLAQTMQISSVKAFCIDEEQKAFFETRGFSIRELSDSHIWEGRLSDLKELPGTERRNTGRPLATLTEEELREVEEALSVDPNALPYHPDPRTCLPQSAVCLTKEGLLALLVLEDEEDALMVSYAYAKQGNGAALMQLLVEAKEAVQSIMTPETRIRITTVNQNSEKLVKKLLPEAEMRPVLLAENDLLTA